jgi:inosine/xanthosine triphosphatase
VKQFILVSLTLLLWGQLMMAQDLKDSNTLIIAVGTTNVIKVQAVEEVIKNYPQLSAAKINPISVSSEISEQPLSLEEIIQGAKNRAKNAFLACRNCHYGFGIESGLFEAKGTQTGYLEACICCIFDGVHYYTGLSCGFEVPSFILSLVLDKNKDLSQACYEAGVTSNTKLGSAEGLIGILSKGRVDRKEYTKQCITTALIQLENASWYNFENVEKISATN